MDTSLSLVLTATAISQHSEAAPANAAIRGRKPHGNAARNAPTKRKKKKTPQRGMGVAQLERLRLQEKWKTIVDSSHQIDHHHLHNLLGVPGSPIQCYYHGVPVKPGYLSDGPPPSQELSSIPKIATHQPFDSYFTRTQIEQVRRDHHCYIPNFFVKGGEVGGLREYEFFPPRDRKSENDNVLGSSGASSGAFGCSDGGDEVSCVKSYSDGFNDSTSLDLSLRLS